MLPAMMRKFHEAKVDGNPSVELWGTGSPRREFLYVEDLADALVFLMDNFDATSDPLPENMFVNVGVGEDLTIKELAELVRDTVGFKGDIVWNTAMPDGTPQKRMDVSRLNAMGWKAEHSLADGLGKAYAWYLKNGAK